MDAYKVSDIKKAINEAFTKSQFQHIIVRILFNIMIFIMYYAGIEED